MPASELVDIPSGLNTILINRYSQSGKRTPPWRLAPKNFSIAQLRKSTNSKDFLATYMAFLEIARFLSEATSPKIVLTDNKCVTRFFRTKAISPALWNACDYVLQFCLKIAHIAGSVNTEADFFSRLELTVREKVRSQNPEDIHTTPIEVSTSSSDVADEEQTFYTQADNNDESEEQTLERKKTIQTKCKAIRSKWRTMLLENKCERIYKDRRKHYVVIHEWNRGKSTNTSRARFQSCFEENETDISRPTTWRILMTTYSRYKHYKANEDRIILKDGLMFRKYFGATGSVKYYQLLFPKQLVNDILLSLHGEFGKHPGTANNCLLGKILLSKNGANNQGVGHVMWARYQRITI